MKKVLSVIVFLVALCVSAGAQVLILNDNLFQGRMSEIKTTVLDSLTNEPVPFASVYVIPSKDTTITNFTLTDVKGEATLEEVPYGSYVFHVEMLGYKPFVKEKYFRNRSEDMGTIKLKVDEQFLNAAVVTDVGNPIVVKKDTVEFNASSFRVGANAMLKDLLARMPGMEITEDGKVKFNGEEIDKLTVGGKTFFFKDQSTALNNLPAAVVDKIRVIDRDSKDTRATGVEDGNKEKVLDVALKKEYEKGWFGNAGIKGGTTAASSTDDDPLRDNRGLLYSGNVLASAYSEKDQITVIGNVQNVDESGLVFTVIGDDGELSTLGQGLTAAAQIALNVNTERVKDTETTFSTDYKYADKDSGTRVSRTTFQEDGNLTTSSESIGKQFNNAAKASVEMEKEQGKVWFYLLPGISYNKSDSYLNSFSETFREGTFVNSSENATHSIVETKSANFDSQITFRELGGKEGRNLRFNASVYYDAAPGQKDETSVLTTASGKETRSLHYDTDETIVLVNTGLRYAEPLNDKWTLAAYADIIWSKTNDVRDAFDQTGRNDYFSSVSNSDYFNQETDITVQYKFGEGSWITLGGSLSGVLNETYSKSYGIEEVTGKDEWSWFVRPSLRFRHSVGNDKFTVRASGYSPQPSSSKMLPVLNVSDPSRLSIGNVYLKPSTITFLNADWTRNNREKFSTLMCYFSGRLTSNPASSAQWYDSNGIMYMVPVNSRKPNISSSLYLNYTTPLDSKKNWTLSLRSTVTHSYSVTYQAGSALPGLDPDTFDYSAFMADFWGSASGDRFYGGASGFAESNTSTFSPSAGFDVKFNQDRYSFSLGTNSRGYISRYSLDPSINMNTLDTRFTGRGSYITKHEFEFESDLSYVFYNGYAEGYGQPEWQWNAEITKNIGAFNLSVKVNDILNQTRNLTHTVTANYQEDSYRLVLGRYILFGVKWNFGKMNAAHSQRAQNAAWNMVF